MTANFKTLLINVIILQNYLEVNEYSIYQKYNKYK
jgi:hypothetical protein